MREAIFTVVIPAVAGGIVSLAGVHTAPIFGLSDKIDNITKEMQSMNSTVDALVTRVDAIDAKVDKLAADVSGLEVGFGILLQALSTK